MPASKRKLQLERDENRLGLLIGPSVVRLNSLIRSAVGFGAGVFSSSPHGLEGFTARSLSLLGLESFGMRIWFSLLRGGFQ